MPTLREQQEPAQKTALLAVEEIKHSKHDNSGAKHLKQHDHRIWTGLILLLNICVVSFLVVVVFVPVHLTSNGPLGGTGRTLYTTSITILASIYTILSTRCIRYLWLCTLDNKLQSDEDLTIIDTIWRNLLGVASLQERFQQWNITAILTMCSLGTAAIVGALVPVVAVRTEDYTYALVDDSATYCVGSSQTTGASAFNWTLTNGSTYSASPNMQFCPTAEALTLLGGINVLNPEDFGYTDYGVAVRRKALGAPASIYSSQTNFDRNRNSYLYLNDTLEKYGSSLMATTQCVPVMTSNPVQCSTIPTNSSGGFLTATAPSGCQVQFDTVRLSSSATLCTNEEFGVSTIVLAAVQGTAFFLVEAMADYDALQMYDADSGFPSAYGIVCSVNMSDVFEYRQVELTLQQPSSALGGYSRTLQVLDDTPCQAPGSSSGDENTWDATRHKLPATAAMAAWQPVTAGLIDTTRQYLIQPMVSATTNHSDFVRRPPYAFSNSRNALEDVLGLTSALVVAHVPMTGDRSFVVTTGEAKVEHSRIGTGNKLALLYTIPSLVNLIAIAFFFLTGDAKTPELASSLYKLASHFSGRFVDAR